MASGCIIGDCWVCDELIWEDEDWVIYKNELIHANCKGTAISFNKKLSSLTARVEKLEKILKKEV